MRSERIKEPLEVQGHRGCRAYMPENSIPGMLKAIEIGVQTLEMDVVISKDKKVFLSHEAFLNPEICQIDVNDSAYFHHADNINLYTMNYEDIRRFDCGSKYSEIFPNQKKISTYKPLLAEVIDSVIVYCSRLQIAIPKFNIEIKSTEAGDGIFHPEIPEFCDLVHQVIESKNIKAQCTLQSFDERVLRYLNSTYPVIQLSYLVEHQNDLSLDFEKLGFRPQIISPYYLILSPMDVKNFHSLDVRVIPWTINDADDILHFIDMGVDGIISDYPDKVISILENYSKEK